MADATRINLYGQFASFKDGTARTEASNARNEASTSNAKANIALGRVENLEKEYADFKSRNSYLKSLTCNEENVTLTANQSHVLPFGFVGKSTLIPESSKFFLCYEINIIGGNVTTAGEKTITLYSQINGSSSKRLTNKIQNGSSVYCWQSMFFLTDIESISQITSVIASSIALTGVTISASITAIPIASETETTT